MMKVASLLSTYLLVEGGRAGVSNWQCVPGHGPQCPRLLEAHLYFVLVLLEDSQLVQVKVEAAVQG